MPTSETGRWEEAGACPTVKRVDGRLHAWYTHGREATRLVHTGRHIQQGAPTYKEALGSLSVINS